MNLTDAIVNASTRAEFCQIFEKEVIVEIDTTWGTDAVSVSGYQGSVSTDVIATYVFHNFYHVEKSKSESASAQKLIDLMEEKIFIPLKNRVEYLDSHGCTTLLIYKIRNLPRIGWTPPNYNLTGGYICLKHSTCLINDDRWLGF